MAQPELAASAAAAAAARLLVLVVGAVGMRRACAAIAGGLRGATARPNLMADGRWPMADGRWPMAEGVVLDGFSWNGMGFGLSGRSARLLADWPGAVSTRMHIMASSSGSCGQMPGVARGDGGCIGCIGWGAGRACAAHY